MERRRKPGPASVGRYDTHTVIQWEREWIKKTEEAEEEKKTPCRLLKLAKLLLSIFHPQTPEDHVTDCVTSQLTGNR